MQPFEILFLLLLAFAIVRPLIGPIAQRISYPVLAWIGLGMIGFGVVFEGWRWQMFPAYLAFAALILASLKRSKTSKAWRIAGAIPLAVLLMASIFLTHQLPIITLPEPAGPYAVGTFEYSITDESRVERYAPERKRELYVEVWYPAEKESADDYTVRTLYQELYEGDKNFISFLLSYLGHIPTHSHVNAPVASPDDDGFPVLLFSHGGMAFTSQNQQLMEHLVSHGYVIFSIGHPYDSGKVNLENAGTIRMANEQPSDIPFQLEDMERNLLSKVRNEASMGEQEGSQARGMFLSLADAYAEAPDESAKNRVLESALANELQPYDHLMTQTTLGQYLTYLYVYQHSLVEYRVEDMQFIADTVQNIDAPVPGFQEALDLSGFGIFGMSFGGAAAGEFCKIDSRCIAGTNLDGTQFGGNWDIKVAAPFLMFYHEAHQGGNDFAYLPPTHEFWDYAVKGTTHFDFVEVAHTAPILKLFGLTGSIDKDRMIDIMNEVQLSFFDHYLKGKPIPGELYSNIPEILVTRH